MKPQLILHIRTYCNFSIEERKSSLKLCRNFPHSHSSPLPPPPHITFLFKSHISKCFMKRWLPGHLLASVHFWHLHDAFQTCTEMLREECWVILVRGSGVRCLWDRSLLRVVTAIVLWHVKAETSLLPPFAGLKVESVIWGLKLLSKSFPSLLNFKRF